MTSTGMCGSLNPPLCLWVGMGTTGDGVVGGQEGMYAIASSSNNIALTLPSQLMQGELQDVPQGAGILFFWLGGRAPAPSVEANRRQL